MKNTIPSSSSPACHSSITVFHNRVEAFFFLSHVSKNMRLPETHLSKLMHIEKEEKNSGWIWKWSLRANMYYSKPAFFFQHIQGDSQTDVQKYQDGRWVPDCGVPIFWVHRLVIRQCWKNFILEITIFKIFINHCL